MRYCRCVCERERHIRIIRVTLSCPQILLRLRHWLVYFLHFSEQDRVSFKYRLLFLRWSPNVSGDDVSRQTQISDGDPASWQRPVLMRDAADPSSSASASEATRLASIMLVLRVWIAVLLGWDGSGRQCSGSGDVQRRFAHFVIDQLRVHQERLHLQRPEIHQRRRAADVHVPHGLSVSEWSITYMH